MSTSSTANRSTRSHRRYASTPTQSTQGQRPQQQRSSNANGHERSQRHHHSSHRRHRRNNRVQPDVIDRLDNIEGGALYHHEGPYDAACRERNTSSKKSPIAALRTSNEEALKATPRENIVDSISRRRPLDGVAYYPPGTTDRNGQRYDYEEGYNMMTEDRGNFRRWPGVKFRDEDFQKDPYYQRLQADLQAQSAKRRSFGFRRDKD